MIPRTKPTIFTLTQWASIGSVVLTTVAMLLYPGGTAHDPFKTGYSFFQNFLSDLGGTVALGGQTNYGGAILFMTGFGTLGLAFAAAMTGLVRLYSESKSQRRIVYWAGITGILSCLSLTGAALTPHNLLLSLHVQFGSLAHLGGLLTSVFFAAATARDNRFPRGVPAAWLLLALVIVAHYSMQWLGPGIKTDQGLIIHVTAQKIAAISVLAIFIYQNYQADRVVAQWTGKQPASTSES